MTTGTWALRKKFFNGDCEKSSAFPTVLLFRLVAPVPVHLKRESFAIKTHLVLCVTHIGLLE
jgi:hypothetical protein